GRVHLAVRRGHHGRAADGVELQRPAAHGRAGPRGDPARGGKAGAADDHDGTDGGVRTAAGGALDRDRGPDATAAGHRGGGGGGGSATRSARAGFWAAVVDTLHGPPGAPGGGGVVAK